MLDKPSVATESSLDAILFIEIVDITAIIECTGRTEEERDAFFSRTFCILMSVVINLLDAQHKHTVF